jgi:hypothetical protein
VNREQANSHGVADLLRGRSKIDTAPLYVLTCMDSIRKKIPLNLCNLSRYLFLMANGMSIAVEPRRAKKA